MDGIDRWSLLLLVAAVYVAVMTLVRMMTARRDRLVAEVQEQLIAEKKRRQKLKAKAEREQAAKQPRMESSK
jgi:hypothetical protein